MCTLNYKYTSPTKYAAFWGGLKIYKVFRLSTEKPTDWMQTRSIDSLPLLRQREGENKKEFQKKSANLLRCRAHWSPRGWNKFTYAFINPVLNKVWAA